jgi:hypothetical protein
MPALQDYSELKTHARTANMTFISDRRAARRTTPGGTVYHGSAQSAGSAEASIQIDGLRVPPCVSLQTPGDQRGLVFRSCGDKQVQG